MKYLPNHHTRKSGVDVVVEDRGYATPCWIWQGAVSSVNGCSYGVRRVVGEKRNEYVHRANWEAMHGPLPEGMELDHLCRVYPCVNDDHLEAVSHQVNIQRRKDARFSPEKVKYVREQFAAGVTQVELGKEFGCDASSISKIVLRKTWDNIEA